MGTCFYKSEKQVWSFTYLNADILSHPDILNNVQHRIRSKKESTLCTASLSPLEDTEDDFPGRIRTAKAMPVNAAKTMVAI